VLRVTIRDRFRYTIRDVMNMYFGFYIAGDHSSIATARVIVELLKVWDRSS
jgi:hypothetical protein